MNKYTSSIKKLPKIINLIKQKKQIPIIDYANENFKNYRNNYNIINDTINKYPNNTYALKFSTLGLSYENDRDAFSLADKLINEAKKTKSVILLDAEQDDIQKKINIWSNSLISKYNSDSPIVYKTYQMYRKDSFNIFCNDINTFEDSYLGIKLVRGAYYNKDKNTGKLFLNKKDTDTSFNNALRYFSKKNNPKHHLIVASHNEKSISILDNLNSDNISVAHLLGFSDNLSNELVNKNYKVYKYLPFGNYRDTFPYLLRRLYENYPILLHIN